MVVVVVVPNRLLCQTIEMPSNVSFRKSDRATSFSSPSNKITGFAYGIISSKSVRRAW